MIDYGEDLKSRDKKDGKDPGGLRKRPKGGKDVWRVIFEHVYTTTDCVALVRERIIPTERPPLVGEVSANL
jgi:hypothetical protein